jgi:hypothetical protein
MFSSPEIPYHCLLPPARFRSTHGYKEAVQEFVPSTFDGCRVDTPRSSRQIPAWHTAEPSHARGLQVVPLNRIVEELCSPTEYQQPWKRFKIDESLYLMRNDLWVQPMSVAFEQRQMAAYLCHAPLIAVLLAADMDMELAPGPRPQAPASPLPSHLAKVPTFSTINRYCA